MDQEMSEVKARLNVLLDRFMADIQDAVPDTTGFWVCHRKGGITVLDVNRPPGQICQKRNAPELTFEQFEAVKEKPNE